LGGMRTVEIVDDGPGIPSAIRRHIFSRFYTTATNGQGAGIGLSFCKMVMESIGGEIQCESREGEYTTFRLIFPPLDQIEKAE
jgi:signal transduction histidine kinase